jgi:hypothetical protein
MKTQTVRAFAVGCILAGFVLGCSRGEETSRGPGAAPTVDQAAEVLAISSPVDRLLSWAQILLSASQDDASSLRDAIANATLDVGDPELVSFALWWARFDPEAAIAWTSAEWRAQSRLVVGAVFRSWASNEPKEAWAYIPKVAEFYRDAAIDSTVVGWHGSGQPGLVESVQSLPDGTFRQKVSESLARRIVLALGTEGATRWLETLSDPGFRDGMTVRVMSSAAEQGDAAAITAWATAKVTTGDASPSGFPRRIGTRWILRNPQAALKWLASLPAGADRDDGVMESYRDWVRFAPAAATQWAENTPLERWSEPAFSVYARQIAKERPEEALALVKRFEDTDLRDRITIVIVRKWLAKDPQAANAWLAKAELAPDVRARAGQVARAGAARSKSSRRRGTPRSRCAPPRSCRAALAPQVRRRTSPRASRAPR